jgi:hypothetical protein
MRPGYISALTFGCVVICGGCVHEGSHAPVMIRGANTQVRLNNVSILDDAIAGKIAVQGSGADRTPTGNLDVWTQLRNRTDYPLEVESRVQFFDGREVPIEAPSAWQRLHLSPNEITTYREASTRPDAVFYFIEIRAGR